MSWEDSKQKVWVFRKSKGNQEIILKYIENQDSTKTITFSLRKDNSLTILDSLTFSDWKIILEFLNQTSKTIFEELDKRELISVAEPTAEPVAEPTAEPVAEPTAEPVAEPTAEPVAEPT
ncbi:MAG: PT domain-containing protein, partial [Candidatus Helarchaeota archaeon]